MPDNIWNVCWVGSWFYFVVNSVQYIFLIDLHLIQSRLQNFLLLVRWTHFFFAFHSNTMHCWCTPSYCAVLKVALTASICLHYILGSVITGMCRAKAGVIPSRPTRVFVMPAGASSMTELSWKQLRNQLSIIITKKECPLPPGPVKRMYCSKGGIIILCVLPE